MSFLGFLRDVGKYARVGTMLAKDSVGGQLRSSLTVAGRQLDGSWTVAGRQLGGSWVELGSSWAVAGR